MYFECLFLDQGTIEVIKAITVMDIDRTNRIKAIIQKTTNITDMIKCGEATRSSWKSNKHQRFDRKVNSSNNFHKSSYSTTPNPAPNEIKPKSFISESSMMCVMRNGEKVLTNSR